MLSIGTPLRITVHVNGTDVTYQCKVIDEEENYLIIDYPSSVNQQHTFPVRETSTVLIDFIEKGTVYKFKTVVNEIIRTPILSFKIKKPVKEHITKVQRREHVRIETDANVAIHCPEESFTPFISVTQDISGGGTAIIIPNNNRSLNEGKKVILYLVLKSEYSSFEYIKVLAEVVRMNILNGVRNASFKFLFDDEQKQQKIIKYCFEIQRENLKKELL